MFDQEVPSIVSAKLHNEGACQINPAILPAIATAVQAAVPLIQSGVRRHNTRDIRQRNDARVDELTRLEETGGLGLSPAQQQLLSSRLVNPIGSAATAARQRQEELIAGGVSGGSAGAAIAALRAEQQRLQGAGQIEAQLALRQLSDQARIAQEEELERRLAAQAALRTRNANEVIEPINQFASLLAQNAGALQGAPPGTENLLGGQQQQAQQPAAPTQAQIHETLRNQGYTDAQINQLKAIFTGTG